MSSPTNGAPNIVPSAPRPAGAAAAPTPFSTPALLAAMLQNSRKISDLFFTPGRPPLVEIGGKLAAAGSKSILTSDDTRRIASDLIVNNQHALDNLKELGSCDVSYSLPGTHRFRVNIFMQRGSCAVVMRVIPGKIPDFDSLNLPAELKKIINLRNGIVLVTGPTGSGKSSTLAAIIDRINTSIVTICSGLYLLIGMTRFSSKWILSHSTWYKFGRSGQATSVLNRTAVVAEFPHYTS